jgi:hypothetical protein
LGRTSLFSSPAADSGCPFRLARLIRLRFWLRLLPCVTRVSLRWPFHLLSRSRFGLPAACLSRPILLTNPVSHTARNLSTIIVARCYDLCTLVVVPSKSLPTYTLRWQSAADP